MYYNRPLCANWAESSELEAYRLFGELCEGIEYMQQNPHMLSLEYMEDIGALVDTYRTYVRTSQRAAEFAASAERISSMEATHEAETDSTAFFGNENSVTNQFGK